MGYYVQQLALLVLMSTALPSVPNATIFGPPFVTSLFNELKQSFSLGYSSSINYTPISQITTSDMSAHLSQGDPVLVNSLSGVDNKSIVIPMFGFSIAVVHSVASFSLNLSQSVLVDIFLGNIRNWNHTNLTDLNVGLGRATGNATINVFTGSLLNRVIEGMSVLANRTITFSDINGTSSYVDILVCPTVKSTPNSIGFAWLGDALAQNSQLASLVNREGTLVLPTGGVASAMSEYFVAKQHDPTVTPHNMAGRFTWPLVAILYLVLPPNFDDCSRLLVVQNFVSFVMFKTSNMDLMVQALGWEPIKSATVFDHTLGKVTASFNYEDILFSLDCGTQDIIHYHTLGTSSQLATSILKALTPYTGTVYANIRMLSADSGIKVYLDAMSPHNTSKASVDMSFTLSPLLNDYPQLQSVPVYMGGIVPFVNIPNLTIVLDRPTLAAIFSRKITYWNHSQIQALNEGVVLPDKLILVLAAGDDTIPDSATAVFSSWLHGSLSTFAWSQVKSLLFTPQESDIRRYVNYFSYSIGYGFSQDVVNASQNIPRLIGFDGQPITFSADALAACWHALDDPKCWPIAIPLAMVLQQPIDCAQQRQSVAFVDWMLRKARNIDSFLVPNPNISMGTAEFCAGRSLLTTLPEPQTISPDSKIAIQVIAGIGLCLAIMQAIALGISRKRSELKSASVLFSLLAVIGVILILLSPFMIVQDDVSTVACGTSIWFLCLGYTLCYGSLFAKLFRLYMIFTSRKLVVPRLSNRKLLWMVFAFLVIDVILLIIYSAVTPAEAYAFSALVPSSDDYVTGNRELTLQMCSFNVDSPVLIVILIFKCLIAIGGAVMAFFIRQVDRRFTAISALGWAFYNMFLTVVVAIILSNHEAHLQSSMIVPVVCGLWIMYVTMCALTLDSNVLLACKDFSQPLRKMLNSGKRSKDSKDATNGPKTSAEKDQDPDSTNNKSHSSTIFVVNREMFPSKYDDFGPELLERILQELNYQRLAVRRVICAGAPSGPDQTTMELSPVGGDWGRTSGRLDSTATRLNSKSKAGPVPLSLDTSSPVTSTAATTPRANTTPRVTSKLQELAPEPSTDWSITTTESPRDRTRVNSESPQND